MRILELFIEALDRRPILSAVGLTLGMAAGVAWAIFNGWL